MDSPGPEVGEHWVWPRVEGESRVALGVKNAYSEATDPPSSFWGGDQKIQIARSRTGIYLSRTVPGSTGVEDCPLSVMAIIIFSAVVITQKIASRLAHAPVKGEGVGQAQWIPTIPSWTLPVSCNSSI